MSQGGVSPNTSRSAVASSVSIGSSLTLMRSMLALEQPSRRRNASIPPDTLAASSMNLATVVVSRGRDECSAMCVQRLSGQG
jgi:hypothetical protein